MPNKELKELSARDILQNSINDIEGGKWVCSHLQKQDFAKANPKEMACAIGLISLNSGDTVSRKITNEDLPYYFRDENVRYEDEVTPETPIDVDIEGKKKSACTIRGLKKELFDANIVIESARYTDYSSPAGAKKAVDLLYNAIPSEYRHNGSTLESKVQSVVNYNDNIIKNDKEAGKWFKDALKLASIAD